MEITIIIKGATSLEEVRQALMESPVISPISEEPEKPEVILSPMGELANMGGVILPRKNRSRRQRSGFINTLAVAIGGPRRKRILPWNSLTIPLPWMLSRTLWKTALVSA